MKGNLFSSPSSCVHERNIMEMSHGCLEVKCDVEEKPLQKFG